MPDLELKNDTKQTHSAEKPVQIDLDPNLFSFETKISHRGFEVEFPVYNLAKNKIISSKIIDFTNQKSASEAIEKAQEQLNQYIDFKHLAETFIPNFFSITTSPTGEFIVITPGLKSINDDMYVGHSLSTFTTWFEAKEFYIQQRETMVNLTHKPILDITLDGQTVSFSDFEAFNPQVAPSNKTKVIPSIAQDLINKSNKSVMRTYQNTVSIQDWQSQVYKLILSYLDQTNPGIKDQLNIKNLALLSPKQAAELSIQIVIDLTKYNYSHTKATRDTPTPADQSNVIQLLQDGLDNRNNPTWAGNGVCRNFANCVTAVFESLKSYQQKYNYLQNTYCLNSEGEEHAPKIKEKNTVLLGGGGGHAWNTFLTVNDSKASAVIIDATWGKRNLETKQIEKVDYTLTRMEEVVFELAKKLDVEDKQFEKIFNFYLLKLEVPSLTGNHSSFADQRQYYAYRLLNLFYNRNIPISISEELVRQVGIEFKKIETIDKHELSCLFKMWKLKPQFHFSTILENYLNQISLNDYNAPQLIFQFDGSESIQNDLQKLIFKWLEKNKKDDFHKLLNESAIIRIRYRQLKPDDLPEFDPIHNIADLVELKYFISQNSILSDYNYKFGKWSNPSPQDIQDLLDNITKELRVKNSVKFNSILNNKSSYEILKNYNKFWREMSQE